jgi:sulfite exporter TauE/SafE
MILSLILSAFAMGLLGSTHCAVMCSGVIGVLSGGLTPLRRKSARESLHTARIVLAYNAGRIASYAVAGAIAGAFGALADRIPVLRGAQLGLRLVAGLLMLAVGLYLAGAWQKLALVERAGLPLWRRVEPIARRLMPARTVPAALGLGALWGWMPCGLVYAALGVALGTGSASAGALTMLAFGAGTLPMLLAVGALAARLAAFTRATWVRRAAGIAVVAFGVFHVVAASAQMRAPRTAAHACCAGKHGAP